jgi:DNA-binding NarL/FixJ family response regulator
VLYRQGTHLSRIRVLLADDNIQVLEYVRDFLSANDYEVVGAVTEGQAAVDAAAQLLPDVVVLDLSMPVLNGIEAAKRMIKARPSTRVVFLTVEKDRDTCHAALEVGVRGYVLKPRLATDLVPAITLANDGGCFVSPGCE